LNKIIINRNLKKYRPFKEDDKIEINYIYEDNRQKKIIKKRNVGVDLIRIISMLE
jgi:hypothetical protein